jgi:hypothetical protein
VTATLVLQDNAWRRACLLRDTVLGFLLRFTKTDHLKLNPLFLSTHDASIVYIDRTMCSYWAVADIANSDLALACACVQDVVERAMGAQRTERVVDLGFDARGRPLCASSSTTSSSSSSSSNVAIMRKQWNEKTIDVSSLPTNSAEVLQPEYDALLANLSKRSSCPSPTWWSRCRTSSASVECHSGATRASCRT